MIATSMSVADKRAAWEHIKRHSPHQKTFIDELKKTFGSIELVSYEKINRK